MSVQGREWAVDRAPTGAMAAAQVLPFRVRRAAGAGHRAPEGLPALRAI